MLPVITLARSFLDVLLANADLDFGLKELCCSSL
jgi:hypothetical protein